MFVAVLGQQRDEANKYSRRRVNWSHEDANCIQIPPIFAEKARDLSAVHWKVEIDCCRCVAECCIATLVADKN